MLEKKYYCFFTKVCGIWASRARQGRRRPQSSKSVYKCTSRSHTKEIFILTTKVELTSLQVFLPTESTFVDKYIVFNFRKSKKFLSDIICNRLS